jgi:hypothetical protein
MENYGVFQFSELKNTKKAAQPPWLPLWGTRRACLGGTGSAIGADCDGGEAA